jgi:hypothetical protein
MNKVLNTFYAEEVKKDNSYATGIVYELEDGRFIVAYQDGYITPGSVFTAEEFKEKFMQS